MEKESRHWRTVRLAATRELARGRRVSLQAHCSAHGLEETETDQVACETDRQDELLEERIDWRRVVRFKRGSEEETREERHRLARDA